MCASQLQDHLLGQLTGREFDADMHEEFTDSDRNSIVSACLASESSPSVCQFVFLRRVSSFFLVPWMCMLNFIKPVFNFSDITQESFSKLICYRYGFSLNGSLRLDSNSATFQPTESRLGPTQSLWSCFHASTVENDSLLYPLGASHNITKSVKPFLNMKQRQINAEKQPSLQTRLGEQNSESNLKVARRVWVLELQE